MSTNSNDGPTLSCKFAAIPATERTAHLDRAMALFQAVVEVQPLANGYAFRLPNEANQWMMAANFIENERRCCPFFHFALSVEPHNGPIWLQLTGGEGVKQGLETMLGEQTNVAALIALINTGNDVELDLAKINVAKIDERVV